MCIDGASITILAVGFSAVAWMVITTIAYLVFQENQLTLLVLDYEQQYGKLRGNCPTCGGFDGQCGQC